VDTFGTKPRFEVLADDTVVSRVGTQLNCGGIAQVHLRITRSKLAVFEFSLADSPAEASSASDTVPAIEVPTDLRGAIEEGAREAWNGSGVGLHVELLDALVHPVDANCQMFRIAGREAVLGWLRFSNITVPAV